MTDKFGYSARVSVSDVERNNLLVFAQDTVRAAGAATLSYFRTKVSVENKLTEGFDPVTEADKAAERIIRQSIEDTYPSHGIYGEEFGHRSGNGLTWVIDPIDGTRAFMSGMLHWGVLLALFDGEEPIVGAMYQPYVDDLFSGDGVTATHSRGAIDNPLRTSSVVSLSDAVLATTGPEWFQEDLSKFESLKAASKMCRLGGDCYVHAMVALGGVDIGTDGNLNPYDIQALIPIVRGAGGVVTTYEGGNPALGGSVLCSANEQLHSAALAIVEAKS